MPPKKSGAQRRKQQKDASKLVEDQILQDACPAEVRGFEGLEEFKKVLLEYPKSEDPPEFPPVKKPTDSEGLQELADELQLPKSYDLSVLAEASRQTQRLEKLDEDGVQEVDEDVGLPFLYGLMEQYLRVDLFDGRTIVGQMKGVDREANLLLNHSWEYWRDEESDDFTSACLSSCRSIATIMIPGKCIQNVCLVQHSGSARSVKKSVNYIEHMIGNFKKQKSQIDASEEARRKGNFEQHTSFIPQKIKDWDRKVEVLATEDNIKFARQTHGRVMNSGGFNMKVFEQGISGLPAETKEDPDDPEQGESSQAAAARMEKIKKAEELQSKKQIVLELMKKRQKEEEERKSSVFG